MTQGRLIAVVGPSGVGKDSLMRALAVAEPHLRIAKRTITRPLDPDSEDFFAATEAEFLEQEAAGAFALSWGAHALHYGIARADLDRVRAGEEVLANLSRGMLEEAQSVFRHLAVLSVSAAPEILAARLADRGRERPEEILKRLSRTGVRLPPTLAVTHLDNSGPLDQTVAAARAALYPSREALEIR